MADVKDGKTAFAKRLAKAILRGEMFLGKLATRSPVVYLTEEPPVSYVIGLRSAGITKDDPLTTLYLGKAWGVEWERIAIQAITKTRDLGAKLIIIDTLPRFAGFEGEDENKQGIMVAAYKILEAAATAGVAVLTLHHARKSGGNPSTASRGSSAGSGIVDQIFLIKRLKKGDERCRAVRIAGRFMHEHPEEKIVIRLDESGQYTYPEDTHPAPPGQEQIYSALSKANGSGVSVTDLATQTNLSRMYVNKTLKGWARKAAVVTSGKGTPRCPKLYTLANPATSAPFVTSTHKPYREVSRVVVPKSLPFTMRDILAAAMESLERHEENYDD